MHEEQERNSITYILLCTVERRALSAQAMTCVSSQQRVSTNGPRLYRAFTGALPGRSRQDCHHGQAEAGQIPTSRRSCWLQQLNTMHILRERRRDLTCIQAGRGEEVATKRAVGDSGAIANLCTRPRVSLKL